MDRLPVTHSAPSTPDAGTRTPETPQTGESTPGRGSISNSGAASGAGTPSSVGFVSLSSLNLLEAKLKKKKSKSKSDRKSKEKEKEEEEGDEPEYLRYDPTFGLDESKYAVLPNDWPYCVPYGVRHYCVWSRVSLKESVFIILSPPTSCLPSPTTCPLPKGPPARCKVNKSNNHRVDSHSPP